MKKWDSNPFVSLSSSDDRARSWKHVRAMIADMPDDEALATVAEYWGYAPLSNFSYNPESPDFWPTPWEMVGRGDWCRDMVAVAMEFTLRLAGWDHNRMTLMHVRDYDISEEILILRVDDLALNYTTGSVVPYPNTHQVITGSWQFDGRKYRPAV